MDPLPQGYECPVHKTQHTGVKRDSFEKELFDALLMTSMEFSYRLYKDVKHGCHCPENYAAFDVIVKAFEESKQNEQTKQ
jgi:hypothetical protein